MPVAPAGSGAQPCLSGPCLAQPNSPSTWPVLSAPAAGSWRTSPLLLWRAASWGRSVRTKVRSNRGEGGWTKVWGKGWAGLALYSLGGVRTKGTMIAVLKDAKGYGNMLLCGSPWHRLGGDH